MRREWERVTLHTLRVAVIFAAGLLVSWSATRANPDLSPPVELQDQGTDDPEARILDFQLWQMTRDLDLSDDQAARVYPKVRRLGEVQASWRRERAEMLRRIRAGIESGKGRDVQPLVARYRARQAESVREMASIEDQVFRELTPRQQAQYVLFRERFARDLRRLMQEARHQEGHEPGPGLRRDGPRRRSR
jgi:Spy/CpxP family protein refolding chaperone